VCLAALLAGVHHPGASALLPDAAPWQVTLVDVADRAGLREPSVYGDIDRKRFII
jgi:hypothetical protein